ncbi:MAG: DUF58 domain-containing protein [Proteobacteria bacterium]|nr:DUF58 domain-containing protein [Pseudomonadota bacterium]
MVAPPWDPDVLARIRRLQLVASNVVDGLLHGDHKSRRVGADIEFADYKEYAPGDPLRDLDWKVLGKTDRLVVRRYQVETELACTVVLDVSSDLSTGHRGPYGRPPLEGTKFGYAVTLAACLLWFLNRHQEPMGLVVIGAEGGLQHVPPRGGPAHMARLFGVLAALSPGPRANLAEAFARIGPTLRRRSLVAIISDFAEETSEWAPSLDALARRRTEVRAFHVLDRRELELDWENPARFRSPEAPQDYLDIDPAGVRAEFVQVRDEWLAEVKTALHARAGRYYLAYTDVDLALVLRSFIGERK